MKNQKQKGCSNIFCHFIAARLLKICFETNNSHGNWLNCTYLFFLFSYEKPKQNGLLKICLYILGHATSPLHYQSFFPINSFSHQQLLFHFSPSSVRIKMKNLKIFLFSVMMLMALVTITLSAEFTDEGEPREEAKAVSGRFLSQRPPVGITCKQDPRICHAEGSPGPHCCHKKCVNLFTDRLNCGGCANKCKYIEICCGGKCVNPLSDKKHCGSCNNRCSKGDKCVFGLCNYA